MDSLEQDTTHALRRVRATEFEERKDEKAGSCDRSDSS